jgi:hypothetical protein
MPRDWDLLVFLQTPDELRYYLADGAAVAVKPDHSWSVKMQLGGGSADDCNKPYKFYAILATREGQEEVLNRLKIDRGAAWLSALPHHGPEAIHIVTLGAA